MMVHKKCHYLAYSHCAEKLDHIHIEMIHKKKPKITNPKGQIDAYFGQKSLGETIAKLAIDGLTFRCIAESETLREVFSRIKYEADQRFPTSHSTVRVLILQQATKLKQEFIKKLGQEKLCGKRVSITGDEYSSLRNRKYINLNC